MVYTYLYDKIPQLTFVLFYMAILYTEMTVLEIILYRKLLVTILPDQWDTYREFVPLPPILLTR